MSYGFLDVAVTPSVKAVQAKMGADPIWQDFKGHREFNRFTENEAAFIADRDSVYMATVSETGWPYVQHRGGPRGFLKVIDEHTLAFADYRGNRQYISTGNLTADDRVCLFLMDYPHRARLKIYAHVETIGLDDDPELTTAVTTPGYKAKLERIFRLHLETFDWNCQQHITPRFTEAEISDAVAPMRARLTELETENKTLRTKLTAMENEHGSRTPTSPALHANRGRSPEGPTG
jgi:predicted pyridoxine 5'-phosphate oxidase superfamily flavin-nucleotide-binding protein